MANIDRIYGVWDNNAENMASDLDEKGVTVRQWRNRNNIPPEYWPKIIEKAAERGHSITVEDFGPNPQVLAIAKAIEAEARSSMIWQWHSLAESPFAGVLVSPDGRACIARAMTLRQAKSEQRKAIARSLDRER